MRFRTRETRKKVLPKVPVAPSTPSQGSSTEDQWLERVDGTDHGVAVQSGVPGHQFGTLSVHGPQGKLTVSQPEDPLEQEADRIASEIVGPDSARHSEDAPALGTEPEDAVSNLASVVRTGLSGGGTPLSTATRREFESTFGHDFSQVRVHTDEAASRSAQQTNAAAYTLGNDVVFSTGKYAPGTTEGDRLLAHELTHVVQQAGSGAHSNVLARQFEVPPAPVTLNAPAEKEQERFDEKDKERARATVITPIRTAAARLNEGEKADIASVLRHLKPIRAAAAGVKWPESKMSEVSAALEDLDMDRTLLESVKLSDREAIVRARKHWLDARRELTLAHKALNKARPDTHKQPDAQEREGLLEDTNAVAGLFRQVDASLQDLVKSPRTQDGFRAVGAVATEVLRQFDTIKPAETRIELARAKDFFEQGLATITPLALGKEESLKQARHNLNEIADRLAALVGDAPTKNEDGDAEQDDETKTVPPPDPAPSPNPLPPPPKPKGDQ